MKTVIITGGTRGIGADIARGFLEAGYQVLIGARHRSGLAEKTQEQLKFQEIDVREESGHKKLIQTALEWTGSLDCYINCAGFSRWSPVEEVDEAFWNEMVDINLKGSFLTAKYTAAAMERSGGGVIVLISSGAGVRGGSSSFAYGASKGGVLGLSLVLAPRLESKNIRVHAVCPGSIDTPLKMRVVETQAQESGASSEEMRKSLGKAEGVGKVLAFLVSDEADYLRGTLFTR